MPRLLSILVLIVVTGCASHSPQPLSQAPTRDEQQRLHEIYRSAFQRGFLAAWDGHHIVIETAGLVGKSTDPKGEMALHEGHMDGQGAGFEARRTYERKQREREKQ